MARCCEISRYPSAVSESLPPRISCMSLPSCGGLLDCIVDELARENAIRTIPVCDKHRATHVKNGSEIQNHLLLRRMYDLSTRIDHRESTTSSCHQPRYSMYLVSEYIFYVSAGRQLEHSFEASKQKIRHFGQEYSGCMPEPLVHLHTEW